MAFFAGWRCTSLRIAAWRRVADLEVDDRRVEALVVEHAAAASCDRATARAAHGGRRREWPAPCSRDAGGGSHLCPGASRNSAASSNAVFMMSLQCTSTSPPHPRPGCERAPQNSPSIQVQRAHALLVPDAAHRLGQQPRDRQLADLAAGLRASRAAESCPCTTSSSSADALDALDRRARQHGVRDVGDDARRAVRPSTPSPRGTACPRYPPCRRRARSSCPRPRR